MLYLKFKLPNQNIAFLPGDEVTFKVRYATYLTLSWQRLYTQAQIGKFS